MLCPDTRKIVKFLTSVIMFVPSEKPSWADLVEEGEEGTAEIILSIESLATVHVDLRIQGYSFAPH